MELLGVGFLESVSNGYKKIASINKDRCKVIDCSNKDIITIHEEIINIFNLHCGKDVL